ncbi:hypothetical protein N1027_00480 [Herbiconiux sp. CPCC 205763]|uniref:Uncharacterized protein n=1 Tax=Herbiconiux aconitum TaxID=2970913 RepID=A0ABT2GK62_9MICO|nr:hypothetical protein [Herbiconiux aconitum]MCS5716607.1 hypothetical protein [Herbiconiux aconitum]
MSVRCWFTASRAHYATLLLAFAWICYYGRDQWFYYDEWDFLNADGVDLLAPHVGHWSTIPILATQALLHTVGMQSYWPYLILAILVHVGLAHVLWRAMKAVGVLPWIATALAFVFVLYGAGADNILWAFQFGFVGGVLCGTTAALIADGLSRQNFRRRAPLVAAVLVLGLMFAGTAVPFLVALALLALRRVGVPRALIVVGIPTLVYLVWYLFAKANPAYSMPTQWQPHSIGQLLLDVPSYAGRMIVGAFQGLGPVPFAGLVISLALLLFALVTVRRQWRQAPLALALALAGIVFALLTGFSRLNISPELATSGRYLYVVVATTLPLAGVALTALWAGRRAVLAVVLVAGAAAALWGALGIRSHSAQMAGIELPTRDVIYATVSLIEDPTVTVDDDALVEPLYAPTLTVRQLRGLVDAGYLSVGEFDHAALDLAVKNTVVPKAATS